MPVTSSRKCENTVSTLTAILCNYNHGKLIGRAIEAMLTQSRLPDELIIVDDGSTDDSCAVIDDWAAKSPVIRFLRNERNLGFHASSARALSAATGDYVYNGAADDYVLPDFFQRVCDLLEESPAAGVACAKVVVADPDGTRISTAGYDFISAAVCFSPAEYLHRCLETHPPMHSLSAATIYRRDILLRVGGWRKDLDSWSDTFAIRAIALQSGMGYVPMEGVVWFRMPGGMSQSTFHNPGKTMAVMRRAAELMRSPEFSSLFPQDYVARWEAAWFDDLVLQQLYPAIEGYQAVQKTLRATAEKCSWPGRCVLGFVRRCMTACYLAAHYLQSRVIRRWLNRLEHKGSPHAPTESAGTP